MGDPPGGEAPAFRLRLGDLGGDTTLPAGAAGDEEREALRLMADAARAEPNDPDYYHILGEALLRAGKVQEATRVCREAVERDPLSAEYRYALGCALWQAGQAAQAEQAFREAVQRQPDDPVSLTALGAALVRLHREMEAVALLDKAIALDSQDAKAWSNLGAALWGAGDHPGALRAFQRAVRIDPEQIDLHRNLALAQRALDRAPEAVRVLQDMIRRWPDRADVHLDLAEAFHAAGRSGEATRALDEAHRLDPRAIAGRPRSREIRDALRLGGVRQEARRERSPRPGPLAAASDVVVDLVGGFRPRVQALSVAALLVALVLGWLSWQVAPHYVTRFLLKDDLAGVARSPVNDDAIVRDRLRRTVERHGVEELDPDRCEVRSDPGWRRISCDYAVRVELLPGLWRSLSFFVEVEQPYLAEPEPTIF